MNRESLNLRHVYEFEPRRHEKLQHVSLDALLDLTRDGGAVADAIVEGGRVTAILGVIFLWEGVANVFVVPSVHAPINKLRYVLYVRSELDRIMDLYELRRVQSNSLDDALTDRWMGVLGFSCEGVLKQYSHDRRDYKAWARFR